MPQDITLPPTPTSSLISQLRELWSDPDPEGQKEPFTLPKQNVIPLAGAGPNNQVSVPDPPQFQPMPTTNDTNVARYFQQLLKISPELQGRTPRIMSGPTSDVLDDFNKSNDQVLRQGGTYFPDPATDFDRSTLMGLTRIKSHNISLNPALKQNPSATKPSLLEVLAHELTHASGWGGETLPDSAEPLVRELVNRKVLKP